MMGEGFIRVGAEGIWEIFVSSPQFCCEPKIAVKHKVLKKKIVLDGT